jgi:hypothetical protein
LAKEKLKEAKDKAQKLKDTLADNFVIGEAISFRFHETALCFINTLHSKPFNTESILLLDKESDIGNKFHHVFWLGSVHPSK